MSQEFVNLLCTHCAPTLSGIKPSCIFTLHKHSVPEWRADLDSCRILLHANGFCMRVLCSCRMHLVVMVYSPVLLRKALFSADRRAFLNICGYPEENDLSILLGELSRRFQCAKSGTFPHEIGLFLGYPLEDVIGFIKTGGTSYRCCGCWKVYGNVERAQSIFREYAVCRDHFLDMAACGLTLGEMLTAV